VSGRSENATARQVSDQGCAERALVTVGTVGSGEAQNVGRRRRGSQLVLACLTTVNRYSNTRDERSIFGSEE